MRRSPSSTGLRAARKLIYSAALSPLVKVHGGQFHGRARHETTSSTRLPPDGRRTVNESHAVRVFPPEAAGVALGAAAGIHRDPPASAGGKPGDRKSVEEGKSVSGSVDSGVLRCIKKQQSYNNANK